MNAKISRIVLLSLTIFCFGRASATTADTNKFATNLSQYRTWSIGVSGGISTPYTLIGYNSRQDFTSPDAQLGYGLYIRKQLSHSFSLQADFMGGKLKSDHAYEENARGAQLYSTVNTKLNWSASLSGNFIVAHVKGKGNKGFMQPYLSVGGGVVGYTASLLPDRAKEFTTLNSKSQFFVPVGAGLKFNLTPGLNLDLGYQVNYVFADDLDGYKYGPSNDRFSYTHIGLEFALGKRAKRQLTSQSRVDALIISHAAQTKLISNAQADAQSGLDAANAKNIKLQNDLDAANANIAGLTTDKDGDGVPDLNDKCPGTPAGTKVDGTGCPLPVIKPEVKFNITEQDKRIVTTASVNLEFYPAKATIQSYSLYNLDRVAQLLTDKGLSLKVEAYTDNVGDADANLKLSIERAAAVKAYLVSRGVNESQIKTYGFGGEHPIASNKTAAGRRLNRRVDLSLY